MIRKIVEIDEALCNGCGACADACHEGAIAMIDGKARLIRDDYCDGLGDCLPECPVDAISIVEREATPFDKEAVEANMKKLMAEKNIQPHHAQGIPSGCPGSRTHSFNREETPAVQPFAEGFAAKPQSELRQWPVQIQLVPVKAPFYENANLLVAADCTAFAYASFHEDFIKNHITIVGCPKLDVVDYKEKLQAILENNNIKSLTIVRMEVPCCGGIEYAAVNALKDSGKFIPWNVTVISTDGKVLD